MINKIKGTIDFYNLEAIKYRYLERKVTDVIKDFGFSEIITPIIESTELFVRSTGEESDIAAKEIYSFLDKGNRNVALRPEGTAGVVRSYIENKLYVNNNLTKLYYFGPMFRYERPQAGRYRQFNQFGVEAIGVSSPLLDADVIMSAVNIFKNLGINNIKLVINTIGDFASRSLYSKELQKYFSKDIKSLCSDCNRRLTTSPLRILDCKIDKDNPLILNAPKINDFLTEESNIYFEKVLEVLKTNNVKYEINRNLVRGLDYYTDTVFEFIIESDDQLDGLAICAGGKYSDLVKSLGGPDLPGVGYAFGVERIIAIMSENNLFPNLEPVADVVIIALDDAAKLYSLKLINTLRENNFYAEIDYVNTTMKQQFKLSERLNAKYLIIVGEEELKNKTLTVKSSLDKTQETISEENIIKYLKEKLK